MKLKKHYLYVNKRGFISLYALAILSIFLLFSMMFTQKIITYAYILKQEDAMMIDLYIVKSLQIKISELDVPELEEVDNVNEHINNEEDKQDEHINNEEDKQDEQIAIPMIWKGSYQDTTLHFEWEKQEVLVSFQWKGTLKKVKITLDENKLIMDYEYVNS